MSPTGVIFLTLLLLAAPDSTSAPHYMHLGRKEESTTTKNICLPSWDRCKTHDGW